MDGLLKELEIYNSELDEGLVIVDYKTISSVLQKYLNKEISSTDVFEWASSLEMRDDIEFGGKGEVFVFLVLFKLATPELEGILTTERAEKLIKVMSHASPNEEDFHLAYNK